MIRLTRFQRVFGLFLAGLMLTLGFGLNMPSLAQAQNSPPPPSECLQQWRHHNTAGLTPECFEDGYHAPIKGLVVITQTESHGWSAFGQFYKLVDGEVKLVAQSPLTTSRNGQFPESYALLGNYETGVGELGLDGFRMRRAAGVVLENGWRSNLSGSVALHGPLGNSTDNPSRYTGGLEGWNPPANPSRTGSVLCFRWMVNWNSASAEIQDIQEEGEHVLWLVTHQPAPSLN